MTRAAGLSRQELLAKGAIACVVLCVATTFKTYPLIRHFGTHIPGDLGDPLLNAWILAWDFHALTTKPWNLFHANIFYPVNNALTFSEHMIGVLPIFAPVYALTGNPILAYNVVFYLSFVLSGMTMFLLVLYWTRNFWASLLSGFLFAFTPIRFGQYGHLQLLNLYWAPLTLLYLEKFLRSQSWCDLSMFAMCYWWQVLCSVYLGWFITLIVITYVAFQAWFIGKKSSSRIILTKCVTFTVLSVIILFPLHLPYYETQRQWGFSRSLSEFIPHSADLLLSYLNTHSLVNDYYRTIFQFAAEFSSSGETWLFPGFVLPLLALLSGIPLRKSYFSIESVGRLQRNYWVILISSFILSLGPYLIVLGWNTHIPLPYSLFYLVMPGFQAMRVPARFALIVVLAASVLAALGFLRVCGFLTAYFRWDRRGAFAGQSFIVVAFLGMFLLELGFKPLPLSRIQTVDEVPEAYRWLAREAPGPIAELPIEMPQNFQYMYFSTYHWLPIINGWSGFVPPTYFQIVQEVQAVPAQEAVEFLGALGVRALVLHSDQLQTHQAKLWNQVSFTHAGLKKVAAFGADEIYGLPAVAATRQAHVELAGLTHLPVDTKIRLGLLIQGVNGQTWVHPQPLGRTKIVVEWRDVKRGEILVHEEKVELPLVVRSADVFRIGIPVRTPADAGQYVLSAHLPALGVATESQVVELTLRTMPTSLNAPHLLAAAYALEEISTEAVSAASVNVKLRVVNTGATVWLAEAAEDRGAVRLGWRWHKEGEHHPGWSGRECLQYDVFPGEAYEFRAQITTPVEPGDYILELDMVSELVTWFFTLGVEPLKIPVQVGGPLDAGR